MLSERLKKLRKEKGITQQELANILNTGRTNIASYEQGASEPGIKMIVKMAEYFTVTVDYLLGISLYKNFEEQAKDRRLNINDDMYNNLDKLLQQEIIDTIDIFIKYIANIENKDSHIIYDEINNNMAIRNNKHFQLLISEISKFVNRLDVLNRIITYNFEDKNLSSEARKLNINFDCKMAEIRKSYRELVEFFQEVIDDLLYYFVLSIYYYGQDNRLI